jgi:hypothetical protein
MDVDRPKHTVNASNVTKPCHHVAPKSHIITDLRPNCPQRGRDRRVALLRSGLFLRNNFVVETQYLQIPKPKDVICAQRAVVIHVDMYGLFECANQSDF